MRKAKATVWNATPRREALLEAHVPRKRDLSLGALALSPSRGRAIAASNPASICQPRREEPARVARRVSMACAFACAAAGNGTAVSTSSAIA